MARTWRGQHGYAMVALLVGLSVAAILMSAAMPTWRQMAQREKETELVFRGQQYARAIGLFQRKSGPGVLPPNLEVLVEQHFLRKKYKDPITGQDFDVLAAVSAPGTGAGTGTAGRGGAPGGQSAPGGQGAVVMPTQAGGGTTVVGGIMGVASKSKDSSIRIYNGRTHYNEWQFLYVARTQAPGVATGADGQPQRGAPPAGGGGPGGGGGTGGRGGRGAPGGAGPGAGRNGADVPPARNFDRPQGQGLPAGGGQLRAPQMGAPRD